MLPSRCSDRGLPSRSVRGYEGQLLTLDISFPERVCVRCRDLTPIPGMANLANLAVPRIYQIFPSMSKSVLCPRNSEFGIPPTDARGQTSCPRHPSDGTPRNTNLFVAAAEVASAAHRNCVSSCLPRTGRPSAVQACGTRVNS